MLITLPSQNTFFGACESPALLGHFSFHTVSPLLLLPEQPCCWVCVRAWGPSPDLRVICYLRPGPPSFCSSLLSQFLDLLLLTFPLSFAECKLYDHITPLLKLFVWFPTVLGVEPTDLQSWLSGVCTVTVIYLFDFIALLFSPVMPVSCAPVCESRAVLPLSLPCRCLNVLPGPLIRAVPSYLPRLQLLPPAPLKKLKIWLSRNPESLIWSTKLSFMFLFYYSSCCVVFIYLPSSLLRLKSELQNYSGIR